MVKSLKDQKDLQQQPSSSAENSSSSCKYTGVRKRKWGKYVSEIRLPNSRERIWLGSYDTAEKAARAFDAALFCLRGPNAKFNFPNNPPEISNGRSMTPAEIQVAAARFAHSDSGRADNLDSHSDSLSSSELLQHVVEYSSCPSGEVVQLDNESTDIPLDNAFMDQFLSLGNTNNVLDYGLYPGFDEFSGDYFMQPLPGVDDWHNNNNNTSEDLSSQSSYLWNF